MFRIIKRLFLVTIIALLPFIAPQIISYASTYGEQRTHWSRARYDRTFQSPDPQIVSDAVVQVLGARTWGWRGSFAIHTWISAKPAGASEYIRYEVIGWRSPHLTIRKNVPDNYWAGNRPYVIQDIRGKTAEDIIQKLPKVVASYPYKNAYTVWPGPNSNSFIAYIGREIPELKLDLPPTAIGKDYLVGGNILGPAISGTGYQLSVRGYGGLTFAAEEGLEFHMLGLTAGIDFNDLVLKMPGFGRVSLIQ